ncbi:DUF305 domain-containing protein [Tsukamurella soli]|uniref:DUF305 domain-containing protein n=1 Tax=Tsukamurella soli TaxID=644556 RepID=A0ABP8JHC6_9ACTN
MDRNRIHAASPLAVAVPLVAALALSGCSSAVTDHPALSSGAAGMSMPNGMAMPGGSGVPAPAGASSAPSSPDRHDSADIAFASMMYPHHAQAIEMAKMVAGKGARPEVGALAASIEKSQQPQMDAFTRLLRAWGAPAPSATMSHPMDGIMTDAQMQNLQKLRGAAFDHEWLTMMIEHHQGAIAMSDTELAQGVNPEALRIAGDIKTGQQREIDQMRALLG